MKLFPSRNYRVELEYDHSIAMTDLEKNTDPTSSLISTWTKKAFRGQVNPSGFKLISSEIGRGAICVFTGTFKGKEGTIEVRIHDAFKVMFSILMLYPIIAFGITAYTDSLRSIYAKYNYQRVQKCSASIEPSHLMTTTWPILAPST